MAARRPAALLCRKTHDGSTPALLTGFSGTGVRKDLIVVHSANDEVGWYPDSPFLSVEGAKAGKNKQLQLVARRVRPLDHSQGSSPNLVAGVRVGQKPEKTGIIDSLSLIRSFAEREAERTGFHGMDAPQPVT